MPQITIYVDRELAEQVRAHKLSVSKVCQAALRRHVRIAVRREAAGPEPAVPSTVVSPPPGGRWPRRR